MLIATALLAACIAVVGAQNFNGGDASWYCHQLDEQDCGIHGHSPLCGTNGHSYRNMCDLSKAHCNDTSIDQKHMGPCSADETVGPTTTLSPEQIVHGSQVLLDFQCVLLSHQGCAGVHTISETICATDGVTYVDFCEYEKARCSHRDLHVQKLGDCNA